MRAWTHADLSSDDSYTDCDSNTSSQDGPPLEESAQSGDSIYEYDSGCTSTPSHRYKRVTFHDHVRVCPVNPDGIDYANEKPVKLSSCDSVLVKEHEGDSSIDSGGDSTCDSHTVDRTPSFSHDESDDQHSPSLEWHLDSACSSDSIERYAKGVYVLAPLIDYHYDTSLDLDRSPVDLSVSAISHDSITTRNTMVNADIGYSDSNSSRCSDGSGATNIDSNETPSQYSDFVDPRDLAPSVVQDSVVPHDNPPGIVPYDATDTSGDSATHVNADSDVDLNVDVNVDSTVDVSVDGTVDYDSDRAHASMYQYPSHDDPRDYAAVHNYSPVRHVSINVDTSPTEREPPSRRMFRDTPARHCVNVDHFARVDNVDMCSTMNVDLCSTITDPTSHMGRYSHSTPRRGNANVDPAHADVDQCLITFDTDVDVYGACANVVDVDAVTSPLTTLSAPVPYVSPIVPQPMLIPATTPHVIAPCLMFTCTIPHAVQTTASSVPLPLPPPLLS